MRWAAIAKCLGVSARTLSRRRTEFGLLDYSDFTDEQRDWNVRDILRLHRSLVKVMYEERCERAVFIIREALQSIDPVNRAIRRRYTIQRRLYNVRKPNHLWHMDVHVLDSLLHERPKSV